MNDPVVSVIVPVYNGARLIGETLDSLWAQSFTRFEVLAIDDCSPDDSAEVLAGVRDPRLRIVRMEQNGGVVRARNRGAELARGRYLAALDQDDLCHPERLARQVAWLDGDSDTVLVATGTEVLDGTKVQPSMLSPNSTPALIKWLIHISNPLVWSSVMVRADAVAAAGGLGRPECKFAEDFDLYHRLAPLGRLARIDAPLVTYRSHAGGASQKFRDEMTLRATEVLARAYTPLFGAAAFDRAALVAAHVGGHEPVPDRVTLELLGETLIVLQGEYFEREKPDRASRHLIKWETAKIWGRIGRAGLRSGAMGLADTLLTRPDHLGLGYAAAHELVLSSLVGGVRRWQKRGAA